MKAMNVLPRFKFVKLIILDVDGVLTNGSLILLDNGEMARSMNIKDGYALQLAVKKGYRIFIISGGNSVAVKLRLEKLGVTDIYLAVKNKSALVAEIMAAGDFQPEEVLYMRDDISDILPMKLVGLACSPADAVAEVKAIAQYISPFNGGQGCVRDVLEKVMKLKND